MSNFKITDLTSLAGNIDRTADVLEVADVSANQSKKATVNQLLSITGAPLGDTDSQTISNKTLGVTNVVTLRDDRFTLQDSGDVTKQAVFELSGITTGTTRTYTLPNASSTLVDLSTAQTLTNKTLTSPTINTATIANPTLTVDTVSEFTGANGVTVDGLNIKDGKLNTNSSVVTANITDDAVTDAKLDYPRWWQEIGRTTLSGAGDTITVSSLPARAYLQIRAYCQASGGTLNVGMTFNGDTGNNYAYSSADLAAGGAIVTVTANAIIAVDSGAPVSGSTPIYAIDIFNNSGGREKQVNILNQHSAAGAGTAPTVTLVYGKWANTSAQINSVTFTNVGTGDFAIGSEVVVLGHD